MVTILALCDLNWQSIDLELVVLLSGCGRDAIRLLLASKM